MIYYLLKDADGVARQRGMCNSEAEIPAGPGLTYELVAPDAVAPLHIVPPSYKEFRAMAYPPMGDQLDALWKLVQEIGAASPSAAAMLAQIQYVKEQFPKE